MIQHRQYQSPTGYYPKKVSFRIIQGSSLTYHGMCDSVVTQYFTVKLFVLHAAIEVSDHLWVGCLLLSLAQYIRRCSSSAPRDSCDVVNPLDAGSQRTLESITPSNFRVGETQPHSGDREYIMWHADRWIWSNGGMMMSGNETDDSHRQNLRTQQI